MAYVRDMRFGILAALVAIAATAAPTPAAAAGIDGIVVVDQRMSGIDLADRTALVDRRLAGVAYRTHRDARRGPDVRHRHYAGGFTVSLRAGRVVALRTTATTQRTSEGIGVHTTLAQLRDAVVVRCGSTRQEGDSARSCHTITSDDAVTVFRLDNAPTAPLTVTSMTIRNR